MNDQEEFIQFLMLSTGAKSPEELESIIQLMGEEGLQLAYALFQQMKQLQLVSKMKFGSKINYLRGLRGKCPEGYKTEYYKNGGNLCKKCSKEVTESFVDIYKRKKGIKNSFKK